MAVAETIDVQDFPEYMRFRCDLRRHRPRTRRLPLPAAKPSKRTRSGYWPRLWKKPGATSRRPRANYASGATRSGTKCASTVFFRGVPGGTGGFAQYRILFESALQGRGFCPAVGLRIPFRGESIRADAFRDEFAVFSGAKAPKCLALPHCVGHGSILGGSGTRPTSLCSEKVSGIGRKRLPHLIPPRPPQIPPQLRPVRPGELKENLARNRIGFDARPRLNPPTQIRTAPWR